MTRLGITSLKKHRFSSLVKCSLFPMGRLKYHDCRQTPMHGKKFGFFFHWYNSQLEAEIKSPLPTPAMARSMSSTIESLDIQPRVLWLASFVCLWLIGTVWQMVISSYSKHEFFRSWHHSGWPDTLIQLSPLSSLVGNAIDLGKKSANLFCKDLLVNILGFKEYMVSVATIPL